MLHNCVYIGIISQGFNNLVLFMLTLTVDLLNEEIAPVVYINFVCNSQ